MSTVAEINQKFVPIGSVKPYDNNPRRIPEDAVAAVAKSLEMFGWQQPIVVDEDNVIVVGHTRLKAAQQLGMTEVPIHVASGLTDEELREYRLVDNKTKEFAVWDHQALATELREYDQSLLDQYFPDVDLEVESMAQVKDTLDNEIAWGEDKAQNVPEVAVTAMHTTEVVCPACEKLFSVRTSSLPGMDPKKIAELIDDGGGE